MFITLFSVFILRSTFEVIYTGLRRLIGSPQDYQKNREEGNFPTNHDLSVPVEETHQRRARSGPNESSEEENYADALEGLDDMELKSNNNGGRNLEQRRTGPTVENHFGNPSAGKL